MSAREFFVIRRLKVLWNWVHRRVRALARWEDTTISLECYKSGKDGADPWLTEDWQGAGVRVTEGLSAEMQSKIAR